jgi:hypothetical protein
MKKQSLAVLRQVPKDVKAAVLVESYFMDNTALKDADLEVLSLKAADAVAEGIAEYLVANCKPRKQVIVEPKRHEKSDHNFQPQRKKAGGEAGRQAPQR